MTTKKFYGLGRRKTAVARVFLESGKGDHMINKSRLADYFTTVDMHRAALEPLQITSQRDLIIRATVQGGGKSAQADAVKLGVARALLAADAGFRKQLKAAGLLTRDAREKERKKPGLKRARRAPQFSKR